MRISVCYKWLLCPAQYAATDTQPTVEGHALNTSSGTLVSEIERTCQENELVIFTWSPVHLCAKLREVYWKPGKPSVGALTFWEDTLRYLYLPRLKNRSVLEQAIVKGAAPRDFFGTAYGEHDGVYIGFQLGSAHVQLDDTLLLIEPAAAAAYEERQKTQDKGGGDTGGDGKGGDTGGDGRGGDTGGDTGGYKGGDGRGGDTGGYKGRDSKGADSQKFHTFIGTVDVNAATAKMRLTQIAEDVISLLASDPHAAVRVTVEINAEFPAGASDLIQRTVSENAASLGFKNRVWE